MTTKNRLPFGSERRATFITADHNSICHDCGAHIGELHMLGCDVEECETCGAQRITCSCSQMGDLEQRLRAKADQIRHDRPDTLGANLSALLLEAAETCGPRYYSRAPRDPAILAAFRVLWGKEPEYESLGDVEGRALCARDEERWQELIEVLTAYEAARADISEPARCTFCGNDVDVIEPICPECKAIDPILVDAQAKRAGAHGPQCPSCAFYAELFDRSAIRMNDLTAGEATTGRAAEAEAVKRVFKTLGALLGSLGVTAPIPESYQTGPQAAFTTAFLDALDVVRAGAPSAPTDGQFNPEHLPREE